ncbi:MAG: gamma-glutamyl-gamma-aminobutyrate hydrolase family protein [Fidelibacterota bacterium]|nr:MAG: gamma-glutamyl-gamma-aminobutyrate hydrolase family protein [Candidatus Neomarinimicrobiota bacterium]
MKTSSTPVIGLPVSPPEDGSPYYNLNPEYTDTVRRAGGYPLAFPLIPEPAYVDRMIGYIHGIVLIGSAYDMDASRYGQEPREGGKPSYPDRDDFDRLLLEQASERGMPVLGICHGLQTINVFLGGTLIQDIASQVPNALTHRAKSDTGEYVHEVELFPESSLNSEARVVRAKTNSAHDQAVDGVGRGLRVIARTTDGVIEAVEYEEMSKQFILGVQWHPERLAAVDSLSFLVFEKLVEAAAAWQAAH